MFSFFKHFINMWKPTCFTSMFRQVEDKTQQDRRSLSKKNTYMDRIVDEN